MIFCAPSKDWCHFSSSALCSTLSSTATAILSDHFVVKISLIQWRLLLQLDYTNKLSQDLFMVPFLNFFA